MDSDNSIEICLPLLGEIVNALKTPNSKFKKTIAIISYLSLAINYSTEKQEIIQTDKNENLRIGLPSKDTNFEAYEDAYAMLISARHKTSEWISGKKKIPGNFSAAYGEDKIESIGQYFIWTKNNCINNIDAINGKILEAIFSGYFVSADDKSILKQYKADKPYFFLAYAWVLSVLTYHEFTGNHKQELRFKPEIVQLKSALNGNPNDRPVLEIVKKYENNGDINAAIECIKSSPEYLQAINGKRIEIAKYPIIAGKMEEPDYLYTLFLKLGILYLHKFFLESENLESIDNLMQNLLHSAKIEFDNAKRNTNRCLMKANLYMYLALVEFNLAKCDLVRTEEHLNHYHGYIDEIFANLKKSRTSEKEFAFGIFQNFKNHFFEEALPFLESDACAERCIDETPLNELIAKIQKILKEEAKYE